MSTSRPQIMGIVNVTPDSFSDGGNFLDPQAAIDHGLSLVDQGADILDVGGESTRPGAKEVDVNVELSRTIPVIKGLVAKASTTISIDTRKPAVAMAAMEAGALIWNDVSALRFAPDSLTLAARLGCKIVLMHAQGDPSTMQQDPVYDDVVANVCDWLQARILACELAGIDRDRLIIDPGIGFGKTFDHNLALIRGLESFNKFDLPLLFGASRKSMIAAIDQNARADQRIGGSIALALHAAKKGVGILRVHDVQETKQALMLQDRIC